MEVFLAFHSEDQAIPMLDTAKRWDRVKGIKTNIVQVPKQGFEIKRRVLADNLSKEDHYILADILCFPSDKDFAKQVKTKLRDEPYAVLCGTYPKALAGLSCKVFGISIGMCPESVSCPYCDGMRRFGVSPGIPSGIRICKKRAIEKWPQQITENYNREHAEAAKQSILELPENIIKQRVTVWEDILYSRFQQA